MIFEHVCESLGCTPDQALFVDDGAPNVAAARRCGLFAEQTMCPQDILEAVAKHTSATES